MENSYLGEGVFQCEVAECVSRCLFMLDDSEPSCLHVIMCAYVSSVHGGVWTYVLK